MKIFNLNNQIERGSIKVTFEIVENSEMASLDEIVETLQTEVRQLTTLQSEGLYCLYFVYFCLFCGCNCNLLCFTAMSHCLWHFSTFFVEAYEP